MPTESGDSIEAIHFMAAFHRVKDACDDDPRHLYEMCEKDAVFRDEIISLFNNYRALIKNSPNIVYPVNPALINFLRDFQKRYLPTIRKIRKDWISQEGGFWQLGDTTIRSDEIHSGTDETVLSERWESANKRAQEDTAYIDFALKSGNDLSDAFNKISGYEHLEDIFDFQRGMDCIESLLRCVDTHDMERRILLLPKFMLPRDLRIAAKGTVDHPLIVAIDEAQKAFVFGLFASAYAMLRTIMEHMVYKQYGIRDPEFWQALGSSRLPHGVDKQRLNIIRITTNKILHDDHLANLRGDLNDIRSAELSLLRDIIAVRDLIELYSRSPRLRAV
jgi:hypothetical protein